MSTHCWIVCLTLIPQLVFGTQFGDIPVSQVVGAPSITNDTNVTLTLGGTFTDSTLKPFTLTLGWTGTLSIGRGGTGASSASSALSNLGGEPALGNPASNGYVLSSTTLGVRSWVAEPTIPVTSVFGRTGAVVAATNDYTFAQIGSKPTTLAGYGITDPVVLTSGSYPNPAWITSLAWSKITGTPTSLAGYGITDPVVLTSGSYPNPSWITSLAWTKLTGVPAYEPALGNPSTDGYVLSSTAAGVRSWIAPATGGGGGTVTSFSSGNLSPLFTTSVATATTTPALSFTLTNAGAYTWFGNDTNASAAPAYNSVGALTGTNDTNVTLTLGGDPTHALLNAASLTLGWTGTLAVGRGGTGLSSPGTSGNILTSNGTSWVSSAPSGGTGTVTSITATSPIVVTPTPLTTTGVVSLNAAVDLALTAAQSVTLTNATTNATDTILTLDHESSGTPAASFGQSIDFKLKDNGAVNVLATRLGASWSNATDATRTSQMDFYVAQSGAPSIKMRLTGPGGLQVGSTLTSPANGIVNADTGYTAGLTPANGRLLQSDGTKYTNGITLPTSGAAGAILYNSSSTVWAGSVPTFPVTASATSRKIIVSDGTNWVASTETHATPGTSGNVMTSDGTNWTSTAPSTAIPASWDGIVKVSGSDFTSTATTLTAITGLTSSTLTVSTLYEFEVVLYTNSSDTNGLNFGVDGSAGSLASVFFAGTATGGSAATGSAIGQTTVNTATSTFNQFASNGIMWVHGWATTIATGTPSIICKIGKPTAGTATVKIGSCLKWRKA